MEQEKISHFFANSKPGVGHWINERIEAYKPEKGRKVLDVACGKRKIPGSIGIDYDKKSDADNTWKDSEKMPFQNNYFDEVFCINFLEHTFEFDKVLTEIYRVMNPGAILHVEVPYYNSYNFGQTPFHHIMFCETTMKDWYTTTGTFTRYSKAKFKILEMELYFSNLARLLPAGLRIKAAHYISNLCYQIYWKLQKE